MLPGNATASSVHLCSPCIKQGHSTHHTFHLDPSFRATADGLSEALSSAPCGRGAVPLTQTPAQSLPKHREPDTHTRLVRKPFPSLVQDLNCQACHFLRAEASHKVYRAAWRSLSPCTTFLNSHFTNSGKELAVLLAAAARQGPPCCVCAAGIRPGTRKQQAARRTSPPPTLCAGYTGMLFEEADNHKQLRAGESRRRTASAT